VEFIIVIIEGGGQNSRSTLTLNPSIMLSDGSTTTGAPIVLELPTANERDVAGAAALDERLTAFPSPAHDNLYVTWRASENIGALTLMDVHGKTLLVQEGLTGGQAQLQLSGLPNGVYILSARTDTGIISKKVLVQR
jgi:hypothetical protein